MLITAEFADIPAPGASIYTFLSNSFMPRK
jgi:hypothetical protein